METRYVVGRWESPWASEPFLNIRVALDARERSIVLLHQRVGESWIRFSAADDRYVRELINSELTEIAANPECFGLRWAAGVPAHWLYDDNEIEATISREGS